MIKRIFGAVVILMLFGFAIVNVLQEDETGGEAVTLDNKNGTAMQPPNGPEGLKIGEYAPNFTVTTFEGKEVKLSDLKDKKVFLNFWATWCPPCRVEMPEMQRFYEEYGEEVEIMAVNVTSTEKSVKDVTSYVHNEEFTFPIYLDRERNAADQYRIPGFPTTYFIGTNGKIQSKAYIGAMDYDFMKKMKNKLE
ncbi:cytochrome C biogenesis protein [Pontibacillus chungwhensis BH030062]|uniref:Cytochrome C biogenesis protein n=1 Tax=Pontibacillus chungwhensis BH030062 TaxID=1385513 RepID=A0A0A2UXG5_9BACI|nr:redoxin domain-containing protein [Pontibacillus chungwhensis]KGP92962.1 cytochrome C biogenesis protein [Pontibacillus chungwhensis BH030062]